jgi:hypothetical protein
MLAFSPASMRHMALLQQGPDELSHFEQRTGIGGGSNATVATTPDDLLLVDTGFENEGDPSDVSAQWNPRAHRLTLCLVVTAPTSSARGPPTTACWG